MYTNNILAAGALVAMVAAVPMADQHHHHHMHQHAQHKRDYVWITHTEEVIETVAVTKTVWVEPGETPDVQPAGYQHPSPPAYTPPAPVEPTTPAYVAPVASTTSVYVAPTPTTPAYVAPTPSTTSVYVAPAPTTPAYVAPTTSAAAAATYAAGSGSGSVSSGVFASGSTHSGDLTYYDPGLGACGWSNTSSESIVAIAESVFDQYMIDANPNHNPLCGKWVTITGADGSPFPAEIVDRCTGCATADLDLSPDFFNKVTNNADGRAHNMKWTMN